MLLYWTPSQFCGLFAPRKSTLSSYAENRFRIQIIEGEADVHADLNPTPSACPSPVPSFLLLSAAVGMDTKLNAIVAIKRNGGVGERYEFNDRSWCSIGCHPDCDIQMKANGVAAIQALVTVDTHPVLYGLNEALPVEIPTRDISLTNSAFVALLDGDVFFVGERAFRFEVTCTSSVSDSLARVRRASDPTSRALRCDEKVAIAVGVKRAAGKNALALLSSTKASKTIKTSVISSEQKLATSLDGTYLNSPLRGTKVPVKRSSIAPPEHVLPLPEVSTALSGVHDPQLSTYSNSADGRCRELPVLARRSSIMKNHVVKSVPHTPRRVHVTQSRAGLMPFRASRSERFDVGGKRAPVSICQDLGDAIGRPATDSLDTPRRNGELLTPRRVLRGVETPRVRTLRAAKCTDNPNSIRSASSSKLHNVVNRRASLLVPTPQVYADAVHGLQDKALNSKEEARPTPMDVFSGISKTEQASQRRRSPRKRTSSGEEMVPCANTRRKRSQLGKPSSENKSPTPARKKTDSRMPKQMNGPNRIISGINQGDRPSLKPSVLGPKPPLRRASKRLLMVKAVKKQKTVSISFAPQIELGRGPHYSPHISETFSWSLERQDKPQSQDEHGDGAVHVSSDRDCPIDSEEAKHFCMDRSDGSPCIVRRRNNRGRSREGPNPSKDAEIEARKPLDQSIVRRLSRRAKGLRVSAAKSTASDWNSEVLRAYLHRAGVEFLLASKKAGLVEGTEAKFSLRKRLKSLLLQQQVHCLRDLLEELHSRDRMRDKVALVETLMTRIAS